MASSTCDRLTFPDEQAEPDDSGDALEDRRHQRCFGPQAGYGESQGVRQPLRALANNDGLRCRLAKLPPPPCPASDLSRAASPSRLAATINAASPNPAIAATFSVPAGFPSPDRRPG